MNARLDVCCALLSALLVLGGVERSRSIIARDDVGMSRARVANVNPPTVPHADSLADAAATIVANNPFRLSNRPASGRFLSGASELASSVPVRPRLTVRAIVGGPPWSAIVEGIPGEASGVVVTAGLVFDKIRIRSITRDAVVMQAPDTTWTLTMQASP